MAPQETNLYYLQSRYYDPEVGRFINADVFVATGQGMLGNNMFAYCRNNPVSRKDASGTDDVCAIDFSQDNNHANDLGNPSGSGGGGGNSSGNSSAGTTASQSTSVNIFLTSQGQNPNDVLDCFSGEPQVQVVTEDTTVFRVWGGATPEYGHWVSPYNYGDAARSQLSLPPGNTMTNISTFIIPAGTTVLAGIASPYFGQPGGGIQWWVHRIECRSQM